MADGDWEISDFEENQGLNLGKAKEKLAPIMLFHLRPDLFQTGFHFPYCF